MALEGVGSKIMIHKATEVVRDASLQQKQAELMQSSATRQGQLQAQSQAQDVTDVYKPSEALIQREKEKRHKDEQKQEQDEPDSEQEREETAQGPSVGAVRRRIDVRI